MHPARGFTGSEQVRRNWTQILTSIPDLAAKVVGSVVSGETVWSEWEHRGTRPDGTPHLMRGVIVFTVKDGLIASARFYLEPRSSRPLVFGRGRNPVNFVSVRDVAALVERVVTDQEPCRRTLEIGGPDTLTLTALARMVIATRGRSREPRHVPRPALHVMAATVGRLRPGLGRQARAALAMDRYDLTFRASPNARDTFTSLPCTSVAELLPRPGQPVNNFL